MLTPEIYDVKTLTDPSRRPLSPGFSPWEGGKTDAFYTYIYIHVFVVSGNFLLNFPLVSGTGETNWGPLQQIWTFSFWKSKISNLSWLAEQNPFVDNFLFDCWDSEKNLQKRLIEIVMIVVFSHELFPHSLFMPYDSIFYDMFIFVYIVWFYTISYVIIILH